MAAMAYFGFFPEPPWKMWLIPVGCFAFTITVSVWLRGRGLKRVDEAAE
jgi:hypothetical protein